MIYLRTLVFSNDFCSIGLFPAAQIRGNEKQQDITCKLVSFVKLDD